MRRWLSVKGAQLLCNGGNFVLLSIYNEYITRVQRDYRRVFE